MSLLIGIVLNQYREPVTGAKAILLNPYQKMPPTYTDDNGGFSLEVPDEKGIGILQVSKQGYHSDRRPIDLGSQPPIQEIILHRNSPKGMPIQIKVAIIAAIATVIAAIITLFEPPSPSPPSEPPSPPIDSTSQSRNN